MKGEPLEKRFWDKVNKTDGCWEWTAFKRAGYGRIAIGNKRAVDSHRISYLLHFGLIPKGMNVLHKCDNPGCVNPQHLFLGTHKDNMRDKALKKRAPSMKGRNNPSSTLTEVDVLQIRSKYSTGKFSQRKLAKEFSVSYTMIHNITSRKNWRHI